MPAGRRKAAIEHSVGVAEKAVGVGERYCTIGKKAGGKPSTRGAMSEHN